jgi:hypothetical protein
LKSKPVKKRCRNNCVTLSMNLRRVALENAAPAPLLPIAIGSNAAVLYYTYQVLKT